MKNLLFVCTGNTCRSAMAEGLVRRLLESCGLNEKFHVTSAGTSVFNNFGASPLAIKAMSELGIDLTQHRARQVHEKMLEEAWIVLTMTQEQKKLLGEAFEGSALKIFTLPEYAMGSMEDIKDPYGGDLEDYRWHRDEIMNYLIKLVETLRTL